jgi:hypothetical protein
LIYTDHSQDDLKDIAQKILHGKPVAGFTPGEKPQQRKQMAELLKHDLQTLNITSVLDDSYLVS